MTNRLAGALSPYLLQHAENPVDWWPWGDEAFAEARRRDVPVLLSVGYAACHWCHVMARESFEDPATSTLMNERFVNVKVDREERPDVDAVYMAATQALTGGGGWPMTVFLDEGGRAFFAGTYFPPRPVRGRPSFTDVLRGIDHAWRTDRERVRRAAAAIDAALAQQDKAPGQDAGSSAPGQGAPGQGAPRPGAARLVEGGLVIDVPADTGRAVGAGVWADARPGELAEITRAVDTLMGQFDAVRGGFGVAPKFAPSMVLEFLLRVDALTSAARCRDPRALAMAATTMTSMARGGIYDQLAGGFARYSVDAGWVVPHFEKMLYDNALLLRVYLHWWRATGNPLARRVAQETAGFLVGDLRTDEGGFASSLDADSEGREGACYVWTPQQVRDVLGPEEGAWAAGLLGVMQGGTFERGTSVLQLSADPEDEQRWDSARRALLAARRRRPQPARDGKVVAAWNGLAIAALAEAGALLGQPQWVQAATECATLLADIHWDPAGGIPAAGVTRAASAGSGEAGPRIGDADNTRSDPGAAGPEAGGPPGAPAEGRLARVSLGGRVAEHAPGVLEDYADVAEGLLALYQVTGQQRWFDLAQSLLVVVRERFGDGAGGFFDTADDAPRLVRRPRDPVDGATPSGSSAAANALLTLAALTGDPADRAAADAALTALRPLAEANVRFAGWAWAAMTARICGPVQVAVVLPGDSAAGALDEPLHRAALGSTSPGLVVALGVVGSDPHVPLLRDRPTIDGTPTAYPCRGFVCDRPVTTAEDLRAILDPQRA